MAERSQYLTMGAASELFAAPVERVQEILEVRPIARLPRSPEELLGVIDVRGRSVPVVDLRHTLGMPAAEDDDNTRIVVLFVGDSDDIVGLKTDRVFEVTIFDEEELESAHQSVIGWRENVIAGIGRRNGDFVTVLNVDRLFDGCAVGKVATGATPQKAAVAAG